MTPRQKVINLAWATALESGKYKQGRECLVSDKNEFCCLGVLLDVNGFKRGYVGRWPRKTGFELRSDKDTRYIETALVPDRTFDWLTGLAEVETDDIINTGANLFAAVNDDHSWSFKKIAKFIRAEVAKN